MNSWRPSAVCIKCTAVGSRVRGCGSPCSLPDSATSRPAGSSASVLHTQADRFLPFIRVLTPPVLCLGLSRRTGTHHCVTGADSAQYSNVLDRLVAQEPRAVPSSPGVQGAAPSRCGRAPDVRTTTKSPSAAFLRRNPCRRVIRDCNRWYETRLLTLKQMGYRKP